MLKIEASAFIEFESFVVDSEDSTVKKFLQITNNESLKNTMNPNIKKSIKEIKIEIDLSVENFDNYTAPFNVGMRTTNYIQQSIQYYYGLKDIALTLKLWLYNLGLNCAYNGGLSSYALCLMIIAY